MLQRVERLKKPSTKMKCVIARPDPLIFLTKYYKKLLTRKIALL